MNEKHVTSLEISKQLKEAGWTKETEFWWVHNKLRDEDKLCYGLTQCFKDHPESWEYYPAPLATEILEELTNDQINDYTEQQGNILDWDDTVNLFRNPDALAKLWLHLKKEVKND